MNSVTQRKAWQDGENLYRHARAVIVIDANGEVIEIKNMVQGWIVNVLAILGPMNVHGKLVKRTVRAEIGFGRTVPYKPAENSILGGRNRVAKRNVLKRLTGEEQRALLHVVVKTIQSVVDREVMHWKRLTYTKSMHSDSIVYTRGKFITVPLDFPLLSFFCLAQDMKTRVNGHLSEFAARTRHGFEKVKYATYSPKELKRIKAVQYTANNLAEANYSEYMLDILRRKVGRLGSKSRALFEQTLEVYKIHPCNKQKDFLYLGYKDMFPPTTEKELLEIFPLDVVTHGKRVNMRERKKSPKYRHAERCLRVEVRPSKDAVARHGMQYQSQPHAG